MCIRDSNVARRVAGAEPVVPPATTALCSLLAYVTEPARRDFQPMNANYGLFPPLERRMRGREKKAALGERALAALRAWVASAEPSGDPRVCISRPA